MKLILSALVSLLAISSCESWGDNWQSRWEPIGYAYQCSHIENALLIQDCQSAALVSIQSFDIQQRVSFSGTLFSDIGQNSTTLANMAHHTLFGVDDGPNGQYCGFYISYNPSNQADDIYTISYPAVEWIAQYPHRTHSVTVSWQYRYTLGDTHYGQCVYFLEDRLLHTVDYAFTVDSLRLWIGANSVAPTMSNDGSSSYAEHGMLYVETD